MSAVNPPPARIQGYFAKSAPVCIIERRGPTRYTQLIRWQTDTDQFEPGQWIKGKIHDLTLTSDGRYIAVDIMGKVQHAFISKPPYFTALEAWIGPLCCMGVGFIEGDVISCPDADDEYWEHVVNASNECPFKRGDGRVWQHEHVIRNGGQGYDQAGRLIRFIKGRIYAFGDGEPTLLYDTNLNHFEPVVAPPWATEW